MKYAFIALTVAVGFSTGGARAADAAPVPPGLLACAQIQDSAERVRCYDHQVAAMKHATAIRADAPAVTPVAPAKVPAPGAAPLAPSQAAQFGQEDLPALRRPKPTAPEAPLQSSITSIRTIGPEMYLIHLENGQVWRQDIAEGPPTTRFFREGDEVQVEKGFLGSYHLSVPRLGTKNWVLVTRVK